ncbi:GMP synthase [Catenaria anguillulae PL171]|uniref:GMP synthase [glutamine-hydrolyzing] n=1 Tax=Catenaria anguillulae PL171 TaxID=765915 RepID=A0A1Y2H671_9FUNG|nr:GMP synthase [Catenaria anguillulae PL171]
MSVSDVHTQYETVLILDFGSQYSHLITRRVRIILSGSPYSVYDKDAPHVDPAVWQMGVPVLGICYGLQEIAWTMGGTVAPCPHREYGHAEVHPAQLPAGSPAHLGQLLAGMGDKMTMWMSHGDQLSKLPEGFTVLATTTTSPYSAIGHTEKPFYGIQFHPEVTHSKNGTAILRNFVLSICKVTANWSMTSFIDKEIERIRATVGPTAQVVLMSMAIGDRFHAILVDNGVMRLNECKTVYERMHNKLGINLTLVDASKTFLDRLKDVSEPERKRKIIGNTFIDVFEAEAARIDKENEAKGLHKIEFLLQGTLYPDTHHNVGGLKEDMKLKVIEPLRELFKDEVRALGLLMGLDHDLVWRHPFPGPGLAIRILGDITEEKVRIVQQADHIYIEEIRKAGLYDKIAQAYAALLPFNSVGVMGDQRTYEKTICLRAVESTDFMTADWFMFPYDVLKRISNRIINEVRGVNRVMYDVSSKPPATIELE